MTMTTSSQLIPGMTLSIEGKIYRVESSIKVSVPKGSPFIKTKLRNLLTDGVIEKNFKLGLALEEAVLVERRLEFLYPEGKGYLFLDIEKLEQELVPANIIRDLVDFLKEGVEVKAMFYGETIFSIELPQFLELMVVKIEGGETTKNVRQTTRMAILETGARIKVPVFVEPGDQVKVDTQTKEYVQRI